MKMKKLQFYIIIFCTLAIVQNCAPKDDVNGIFTGKSWKMTNIFKCRNLNDDGTPLLTQEELIQAKEKGHFQVFFEEKTFSGIATNAKFSGIWEANNKDNSFNVKITQINENEKTELGKRFINFISSSKYYLGDYMSLKIFDDKKGEYILFRIEE